MPPVDYDDVAPAYDRRYANTQYDGVGECLRHFLGGDSVRAVLEVGCGTGHWLADLASEGFPVLAGLDLSVEMLARAQKAAPAALLVRGTASALPWPAAAFDRVFCVNALHHFADRAAFLAESRRVLQSGGGLLTIGLDPHVGGDRWWVYDYFPSAVAADQARYPATATIRSALTTAGYESAVTEVAQHIRGELPFASAEAKGFVDRRATSQLMVISDDEYEAGLARLRAERPTLRSDLRLYATIGWA